MLHWSTEGNLTLSNTNQDIENLTNKDVLIFMGGTNDVHKNNSINGLRYIPQFVNKNTQTNIIMLNTSRCYDHSDTSNVNNQVKKFNRKLRKYMKLNTHVTITDVDQNGVFYCTWSRKKKFVNKLTITDKLFQTEKVLPICTDWETNQTIRRTFQNTNICNDLKNTNRKDNIDSEVNKGNMLKETTEIDDNTKGRTSTSQRKVHSNKNVYFLWKF
jgi:hypothetical protein